MADPISITVSILALAVSSATAWLTLFRRGKLCPIGLHTWQGCKCARCGKTRDEGHNWSGCKCSKCGKPREEGHDWNGCRCSLCGAESHDYGWVSGNGCYISGPQGMHSLWDDYSEREVARLRSQY